MKLTRLLYRTARMSNDIDAALNPKRAPRRVKNKLVGRALRKAGVWRRLWR